MCISCTYHGMSYIHIMLYVDGIYVYMTYIYIILYVHIMTYYMCTSYYIYRQQVTQH